MHLSVIAIIRYRGVSPVSTSNSSCFIQTGFLQRRGSVVVRASLLSCCFLGPEALPHAISLYLAVFQRCCYVCSAYKHALPYSFRTTAPFLTVQQGIPILYTFQHSYSGFFMRPPPFHSPIYHYRDEIPIQSVRSGPAKYPVLYLHQM